MKESKAFLFVLLLLFSQFVVPYFGFEG